MTTSLRFLVALSAFSFCIVDHDCLFAVYISFFILVWATPTSAADLETCLHQSARLRLELALSRLVMLKPVSSRN
jgi:hypothetical protein